MLENNSQLARRRKTPWLKMKRGVRRKRSSKVGLCAPNTPYNSSSFLMRVQQKKETPIVEGVEELGVYEYGSMADFIHLPAFSELVSTSSCPDAMLSLNLSASAPKPSATTASANLRPFQDKWVRSPVTESRREDNGPMDRINNGQSVQTSVASSCTGISALCISQPNWRADDHLLMKVHTKIVQALMHYRLNGNDCVNQALLQPEFASPNLHSHYLEDAGKSLLTECLRLIQQELAHLRSKASPISRAEGSDEDLNSEAGSP